MGDFLNEFASKLQVFWPLFAFTTIGLPVFGYFYNRLMDRLHGKEHTSIYVTGGVLLTIGAGALFSWKSALLFLILFGLDGFPMIIGDYKRDLRKEKNPRRKRMPYAANGLLDEAKMAGTEARHIIGKALKAEPTKDDLHLIEHELNTMMLKIVEIKNIQVNEK